MLPLLRHLQDGREHSNQETLDVVARQFALSDQDLQQLLPSGRTPVFTNRLAWAKAHLKAAGLLDSPRRAHYKITPRGQEVLSQNPERVDLHLLRTYPEYKQFRGTRRHTSSAEVIDEPESPTDQDGLTPEEHLEYGYQRVREDLAVELLRRVKEAPPAFFERVVL